MPPTVRSPFGAHGVTTQMLADHRPGPLLPSGCSAYRWEHNAQARIAVLLPAPCPRRLFHRPGLRPPSVAFSQETTQQHHHQRKSPWARAVRQPRSVGSGPALTRGPTRVWKSRCVPLGLSGAFLGAGWGSSASTKTLPGRLQERWAGPASLWRFRRGRSPGLQEALASDPSSPWRSL